MKGQELETQRIFVAGHRGMVGSAIVRRLTGDGRRNLVLRSRSELDLTDRDRVRSFFQHEAIDQVVVAAAKVGGILANHTYPAEFIYQNLMIEANLIHEACQAGINRLLFLGSSCIYPREALQPIREEELLSGYLEPTNQPYAIAKIAGIEMCQAYNRQYGTHYRSLMPTNLYGPNDNYDLQNSHVLPAMIRKFHLAKLAMEGDQEGIAADEAVYGAIPADIRQSFGMEKYGSSPRNVKVVLWGSGRPMREFLHVDDLAAACCFVMDLDDDTYDAATIREKTTHLNIGTGQDIRIRDLAEMIQEIVGYRGLVGWDTTKPDGTPRKLLRVDRMARLGWNASISLEEGIRNTYDSYRIQSQRQNRPET